MNKFFLLFVAMLAVISVDAQDKIITINNDTILCRIMSINDVAIRYEQLYGGKVMVGKIIPLSNVAEYHRLPAKNITSIAVKKKMPWQLSQSVGGGLMPWLQESYRAAGINNEYTKIEHGVQIGIQAHYFVNQSMALGVQYAGFTSGINGDVLSEINPEYPIYTYAYQRERHFVNYIGVSALFQQPLSSNRKFYLTETISGGAFFYRGESQSLQNMPSSSSYSSLQQNSLIEGITVGAGVGISAGYLIRPDLSIGTGVDFLHARLKKVDFEYKDSQYGRQEGRGVELNSPLDFSRFNYSIVLRYSIH